MSLYDKCSAVGPCTQLLPEYDQKTISLLPINSHAEYHMTIPDYLNNEQSDWMQRTVYYVSDLHLVHHILQRFPCGASDFQVQEYVHEIVENLFSGDFGNEVQQFKAPVVLFGGDTSSVYSIAELFYNDFVVTWENKVDNKYRSICEALKPIQDELTPLTDSYSEWAEKHSWIRNATKPLEEYSDKKVPCRIKELLSKMDVLEEKLTDRKHELGLGYSWESDYSRSRKHPFIYAILGNHELWDFGSYEACVKTYNDLFSRLGMIFLENQIAWLGPRHLPTKSVDELCDGVSNRKWVLLSRDEDPDEYERQLLYTDNLLIVGGLGFARNNPSFNAEQGIYGSVVSRKEEIERCAEWNKSYLKAVSAAKRFHCSLVVLTHMPIADWGRSLKEYANCVFFSGHNHRNIAYGGENNTFVFADNQIGYKGCRISMKKAVLHIPRNPFAADPDGYREITAEEYKEFYRFVRETLPGTGTIDRQIKEYDAHLYIIKQDGYVGFFLLSPRGVYICNGGQLRKIGVADSLERYANNFMVMIGKYITAMTPLRRFQEQLSSFVKSFGGRGTIHGTIVDIDRENHIMVNTFDGSVTPYNSPVFGIVKAYTDLGMLLHEHCPLLEARYKELGENQLVTASFALDAHSQQYEHVDIKNSPYALSRRVNALQRLFDKRILRAWNPDLEEI